MNDKHDDALRALYQNSRQEQPSGLLDQRIRKAAERRLYRTRKRWIWGLSTAAVLVLSFNVVLNLIDIEPASQEILTEAESLIQDKPAVQRIPEKKRKQETLDSRSNWMKPLPASPQQKSDVPVLNAPVLKEQKKLNQKSRQRIFSAPQPAEERVLEHDLSSGLIAADRVQPNLVIPELPFQLDALLKLDTGLSGEQSATGLMTIYAENKLILTGLSVDDFYVFKAWPGAQKLGVKINWNIKPSQLDQCSEQNVYISCALNDQVEGLFEQNRLDHISWKVSHD